MGPKYMPFCGRSPLKYMLTSACQSTFADLDLSCINLNLIHLSLPKCISTCIISHNLSTLAWTCPIMSTYPDLWQHANANPHSSVNPAQNHIFSLHFKLLIIFWLLQILYDHILWKLSHFAAIQQALRNDPTMDLLWYDLCVVDMGKWISCFRDSIQISSAH